MAKDALGAEVFMQSLRDAYAAQDDILRVRYNRSLPIQDTFDDRWERARKLGFGEGASIYNSAVVFGDITVGAKTWIGPYVILDGSGGLSIGSTCSISCGVHIYSHDTVEWALSGGQLPYRYKPAVIGDCCYVGSQAVIAAGVSVGATCVISANSLVKDDVPPRTIVGGIPARRIGEIVFEADRPKLVYDHKR